MAKTRQMIAEEQKVDDAPPPPAPKPKRRSDYSDYVKSVYHTPEILKLPVRDRFKRIAVMWKQHKADSK